MKKTKVNQGPSERKKKILAGIGILVGIIVLAGGIYYTWLIIPPSLPKTPEEGIKLMQSARFKRLPEYRKEEYIEHIAESLEKMEPEKRRELFEKYREDESIRESMRILAENRMRKMVLEYAKASPEQRIEILDRAIDFMAAMRQRPRGVSSRPSADSNRREARRDDSQGPRRSRRGGFRNRMMQRVERGNPQITGLVSEFFMALRQRMKERGIEPPRRR